jgi:hypothetical protein
LINLAPATIKQFLIVNMIFNKQIFALGVILGSSAEAFSPSTYLLNQNRGRVSVLQAQKEGQNEAMNLGKSAAKAASTIMLGSGIIASIFFPGASFANEIGVEVEAPTLYTGETIEVS